MEASERNQLKELASNIVKIESVVKLAEADGYAVLLKKLSEARVDAIGRALGVGDTTEDKCEARIWGTILDIFYSIPNGTELTNLINMKESLERDIGVREDAEKEFSDGQYNGGNSMV